MKSGVPEPVVSVVMPVRNGAATVEAAIRSIQAQTLPAWELITVDDGSADDTAARVAHLAATDPRIRLLARPAQGIVPALQAGLGAARGRSIARMDADDVAHPERLAAQHGLLEARPDLGLVSCLVEFGGDQSRSAGYALHVDWINRLLTPEQIALNRFVESPLAHPSVLFRRELVARHGGYEDGDFPEDYALWLRWLDAGVRMAKVPRVLLRWNDPPERASRTASRYAPDAFFRLKGPWLAREVQRLAQGRPVWVWGAGRPTRKRAAWVETAGVRIAGYVDVDGKKATPALGGVGRPVITADALPGPEAAVVLGYVSSRGARDFIRAALCARDYLEGRDFLMCA